MELLGMRQHTHLSNLRLIEGFLMESRLSEKDIIKFEAQRGDKPIVHVTNYGFLRAAPAHTTWTNQIGIGGNVHRSAEVLGVELVSVFRSNEL